MNRIGIMVDISHVSDEAFYQVMDVTEVPAIATHSSCRHFTPGWERNMSDDMIKRLAENGVLFRLTLHHTLLIKIQRIVKVQLMQMLANMLLITILILKITLHMMLTKKNNMIKDFFMLMLLE
ncbi:MAG: hypothetical protein Ct9H90mP15_05600 [Candidatus Neomarinimicrobiota bacterium]|nr:MAG: hypothetical protein Ct9H90mP15_05600 [Candidatus Neomarinimicrobiota bacterium]